MQNLPPAYFRIIVFVVLICTFRCAAAQSIFFAPSYDSTDAYPAGVTVADLNRDGNPDIVTVNQPHSDQGIAGSLSVLMGNGDGTFQAPVNYAVGNQPGFTVVAADVNGDGYPDLATQNFLDNTISLLIANGDGTFQASIAYATGASPTCVALGDLNGDGKSDLVTSNLLDGTVSVLMGRGDGTFDQHVDYAAGLGTQCVAIGDLNNDGQLDLVTANIDQNSVAVLLGNANGTFDAAVQYFTFGNPNDVILADLNGDGKVDVAATQDSGAAVSVYLGNGDGTLQTYVAYPVGNEPTSLSIADFDGNGTADLAVTNLESDVSSSVSLLLGNGDGTFQGQQVYAVGSHLYPGATADLNKDGHPDLAVPSYLGSFSNTVAVLLNDLPSTTFLTFPLLNKTSGTAAINSVFDHSMDAAPRRPKQFGYCPDNIITAYTGEQGLSPYPSSLVGAFTCGATKPPTTVQLYGWAQEGNLPFIVNGHYNGDRLPQYLFYDGHPGFDYVTTDQTKSGKLCGRVGCNPSGVTPVLAAAAGVVVCVNINVIKIAPCLEGPGEIKIDHGNGYFTVYLHLSAAEAGIVGGVSVSSGQQIGLSGHTGANDGGPHLHFEVRKGAAGSPCQASSCFPVDPYGWLGSGIDPYIRSVNSPLWQ